jgi:hypothetical protein
MSIKPNLLSLCLLGALLLSSCDKGEPTVIQGVVTDRKTGAPVEGARVFCTVQPEVTDSEFSEVEITNANGEFRFSFPNSFYSVSLYEIEKGGYLKKFIQRSVTPGSQYFADVQLFPLDGVFRLKFKNNLGLHDTVYHQMICDQYLNENPYWGYFSGGNKTAAFKSYIIPGDTLVKEYRVTSDSWIKVSWGFNFFREFSEGTLVDSVYLAPLDTAELVIQF